MERNGFEERVMHFRTKNLIKFTCSFAPNEINSIFASQHLPQKALYCSDFYVILHRCFVDSVL